MGINLKLIEQTLLQMLEIQIRTTALNKSILLLGGQEPHDVIMLSLLTTVPFDRDSVELIENIINGPFFYRLEGACVSAFGLSYASMLREYAGTISATFDQLDEIDEMDDNFSEEIDPLSSFADASSFFEHSEKMC